MAVKFVRPRVSTIVNLFHNAALFIQAFNQRLGSVRRNLEELRLEKDHGCDGWVHLLEGMKSDPISAFGY